MTGLFAPASGESPLLEHAAMVRIDAGLAAG
jgi:hypothetical protein